MGIGYPPPYCVCLEVRGLPSRVGMGVGDV